VSDTIIVFDRIRENLPKSQEDFENTINRSVNQTLTRSINTSFSAILALLTVLFFGGATIKVFALALIVGIFVGTYSSIFIASPALVVWDGLIRRRK
jgi:preprotein translocase subunit SecF